MSINLDENGQIILEDLNNEEKLELKSQVEEWFSNRFLQWFETYKPLTEELELGSLDEEEVQEALSGFDDSVVWADKNIETSNSIEPIVGLTLNVSGWAYVAGKSSYPAEYGEKFTICEVPFTDDAYEIGPIFHLSQMACPFCEAQGCEICDDEGEWEFWE